MTPPRSTADAAAPVPEWAYDPLDDDFGDEVEDEVDCGLMADGQCLLAGSEWCDWDCGRLG